MAVCFLLLKFRASFLRNPASACHIHLRSADMKSKNSLPDRWTEYIPIGKRIPGTRFIAFKVPLKNVFDAKLAPWQRFSPSNLIQEVKKQNEELGMVVDLTCTQRYYSPQEFPEAVTYCKIFTIGHEVPSDEVIAQFKSAVKQYLTENEGNDKLVGVHCTHGLNRTGYLVCRYLIDVLSMEPSEAIEKFNKSRGHSIERSNYLQDLLHGKSRSNAGIDNPQGRNGQHFPSKATSHPPRCPPEQPWRHSNARSDRPQAHNPPWFPKHPANSQPPPYPEVQPWSHSHTVGAPRRGPRPPGPPVAQPPSHHRPGPMMGPARRLPCSGGRSPSYGPRIPRSGLTPPHVPGPRIPRSGLTPPHVPGPRIPRSGLPPPHVPGPRHNLPPQVEGNSSHHFRGPNRHWHHPPRPYPQHRDYDEANSAPPQDSRPRFSQQRDDSPGNYIPAQHSNKPYQRYPKPGGVKNPKNQWP